MSSFKDNPKHVKKNLERPNKGRICSVTESDKSVIMYSLSDCSAPL